MFDCHLYGKNSGFASFDERDANSLVSFWFSNSLMDNSMMGVE